MIANASADSHGCRALFLVPTVSLAEDWMTEQNVFQQSSTSSDRVLSWANLFCTVTLYCCWSVLSYIRRGMSKMLEESGFLLGFNKVRHNSATRKALGIVP